MLIIIVINPKLDIIISTTVAPAATATSITSMTIKSHDR